MKKETNKEINKIPLFDKSGKKSDAVELDKEIFNGKYNEALLYQSLNMYRANMRRGTASTKTRGEVSGGGKKPWKQKGTGRARAGSIRSPLWRHGGTVFGPHPRDFRYDLPKKMKRSAFISSLNAKLKSGKISAIGDANVDAPKTKKILALLKGFDRGLRILLLVKNIDRNLFLAARNVKKLTVKKLDEATALDVLSNDEIVVTKEAAQSLSGKAGK